MAKSLQDILKLRQEEEFVGRENQLAFFEANLGFSPEDPRHCFIVNVYGQGGVGKTWLLRQFHRIAEDAGAVVAYTYQAEDDVPDVLGCFAAQFADQGHPLKTFAERYKVYCQCKEEIEADPEAPQGLFEPFPRPFPGSRDARLAPRVFPAGWMMGCGYTTGKDLS
jgi:hypothetical protein